MRSSTSGAAVLIAALLSTAAAAQQDQPPPSNTGSTHRLAPEEVDRILAEAAERRERVEADEAPGSRVHGEVGFTVGTGGMWGMHGNAMMQLGDDGFAGFSFDTGAYPSYDHYPTLHRDYPPEAF